MGRGVGISLPPRPNQGAPGLCTVRIHGDNYDSAHIGKRDARVLGLREWAGSGSVFLGRVGFELGRALSRQCERFQGRRGRGHRPRRAGDDHDAAPGTHRPGRAVLLVPPSPGRERTESAYVQVGDGLRDVLEPQSHA